MESEQVAVVAESAFRVALARLSAEAGLSWLPGNFDMEPVHPVWLKWTENSSSMISGNPTFVKLRIDVDRGEMWIYSIEVNPVDRGKGWGTVYVKTSEAVAYVLGIKSVKAMPLHSALEFWKRMCGYCPDGKTPNVVVKELEVPGVAKVEIFLNLAGTGFVCDDIPSRKRKFKKDPIGFSQKLR
ncbi:MAG TPA: hypothetical protein EYQ50_28740 [Verrucomicrobiales bacterium]|nr:hypothetical protein [Verrucomicrobiales bacterium]HIL69718.1 hypothetical protein [Verrucomicrobiota bacterium]